MVARTKEKPHNHLINSQVPLDSRDNSAVMTGDVIKAGPLLCYGFGLRFIFERCLCQMDHTLKYSLSRLCDFTSVYQWHTAGYKTNEIK